VTDPFITAALAAATKAVAGCNVSWATAIDDPQTVARAALNAAWPHLKKMLTTNQEGNHAQTSHH